MLISNKTNIDIVKWKEFKLDDLFFVEGTKTTKVDELENYGPGKFPYVTTQATNNGVGGYYDFYTEEGNVLTMDSAVIGYCSYQEFPFTASDHVEKLIPKFKLNKFIALFLVTLINKNQFKFSYGRKCNQMQIRKIDIMLPVDETGNPDWIYMESYIKAIWCGEYKTNVPNKDCKIETINWKEFKLGDIFTQIYKGKAYVKGELIASEDNSGVPFVSRTDMNNGCDGYVEGQPDNYKYEKGNAFIIGDTTSTCYYQEDDFICGDHIVVLRAEWLNKYNALFIKTLIEKERYKYSYGRSFKMDLIKKTILKLPVTNEEEPDWNYMEQIIKSMPFSDKI